MQIGFETNMFESGQLKIKHLTIQIELTITTLLKNTIVSHSPIWTCGGIMHLQVIDQEVITPTLTLAAQEKKLLSLPS